MQRNTFSFILFLFLFFEIECIIIEYDLQTSQMKVYGKWIIYDNKNYKYQNE